WSWTVTDKDGIQLTGVVSGTFDAYDTNYAIKGKLRKHTDNANRWATERNTGTTFLAFGDTQYTLMDKVWTSEPDSSKGGAGDWDAVIDDSYDNGATLIRAGAFGGYSRWNGSAVVGPYSYPRPNWPWADGAEDGNKDIYDLLQLTATDTRLMYSLNKYEDLYFELILSPKTKMWGTYWEHAAYGCTATQIENYRKYMTARLSAYPNVIFQLVYDIDFEDAGGGCGANPKGYGDENYAFAQNWLDWLRDNDPFNTMRCIGNGNDYDDPFTAYYYNQTDPPPTYLHDEAIGDISGKTADKYYGIKSTPIFHGEDTYEVDAGWGTGTTPSDNNPEYYYRRVFWADILSGAYPCYGGGYKSIIPYNDAYNKVNFFSDKGTINIKLHGQDDVIHIKDFFADNKLDIADFHPADSMAINGPSAPSQIQVAYNSLEDEYIVYHPNATKGEADYDPNDLCEDYSDKLETLFSCSISNAIPAVTLRLFNGKKYIVKWFDPSTGTYFNQSDLIGAGVNYTLTAPSALSGKDAVLLLDGEADTRVAIIAHRGGKLWAPENTLAAFKKCADNNLDWETDLNLTADGEIILMHDITMDTKIDELSPGSAVYQSIIDKIAARNLFDRVFIEVFSVDAVNKTRILNNGDKLKYAISSGYFSRIHASSKIAYKADDVHAGGVPYFSAHPTQSHADWDSVKNYNIDGVSTDKADVTLFVIENEIPACSIINPVNGADFNGGATITIKADVGDSDSSITKVEFYRNGSFIGKDTLSPYTFLWTDVSEGSYSLTIKVFDNGMSKISASVNITVETELTSTTVPARNESPVKLIFDTDMYSDVDDVGALAMLHAMMDNINYSTFKTSLNACSRVSLGNAPMAICGCPSFGTNSRDGIL
ncbi:MAG: Ig-like domain-containing protein, partial [Bacteroidales bacterium]